MSRDCPQLDPCCIPAEFRSEPLRSPFVRGWIVARHRLEEVGALARPTEALPAESWDAGWQLGRQQLTRTPPTGHAEAHPRD